MSVVPVIAVFTKFDMLVRECWNEVDESLRYSEEGEHMAQQHCQKGQNVPRVNKRCWVL